MRTVLSKYKLKSKYCIIKVCFLSRNSVKHLFELRVPKTGYFYNNLNLDFFQITYFLYRLLCIVYVNNKKTDNVTITSIVKK